MSDRPRRGTAGALVQALHASKAAKAALGVVVMLLRSMHQVDGENVQNLKATRTVGPALLFVPRCHLCLGRPACALSEVAPLVATYI